MNKEEKIQSENQNETKNVKNIEEQKNENNMQNAEKLEKEEIKSNKDNIQKKTNSKKTKIKSKSRMLLVLAFIIIFAIISYVFLRGSYLEYKELGESYVQEFFTNLKF